MDETGSECINSLGTRVLRRTEISQSRELEMLPSGLLWSKESLSEENPTSSNSKRLIWTDLRPNPSLKFPRPLTSAPKPGSGDGRAQAPLLASRSFPSFQAGARRLVARGERG